MYNAKEVLNKVQQRCSARWKILSDFLFFFMKRAQNDTILRVAASLSYTSLLAIVPLFLIMISIFSVFPVFADLREPLQTFATDLLPSTVILEVNQYIAELAVAAGKFTTVGVIGLAVTSILMLSTIENSLNFIFKVTRPRRFTTKLTLYWTVITLGPLLIGTAFSLRGYFYTLHELMPEEVATNQILISLLPSLMIFVMLVLVYVLVPNKKVNVKNASVGALLAVVVFSFLRKMFTFFILKSATYQILYGALAIIPIFLVWMYLAWAVVILGAVMTAALDEFKTMSVMQLKKIIVSGKPEKRH